MSAPVRGRRSFERLRREGRRARHGALAITYVADETLDGPRVAFAIGRSVGTAPQRNRLRRRLRHLLARLEPQPRPGLYLLRVAPPAIKLSHQELTDTVTRVLRTVRALP